MGKLHTRGHPLAGYDSETGERMFRADRKDLGPTSVGGGWSGGGLMWCWGPARGQAGRNTGLWHGVETHPKNK